MCYPGLFSDQERNFHQSHFQNDDNIACCTIQDILVLCKMYDPLKEEFLEVSVGLEEVSNDSHEATKYRSGRIQLLVHIIHLHNELLYCPLIFEITKIQ